MVSIVVEELLLELEIGDVLQDALEISLTDVLREVAVVVVEGDDLLVCEIDMGNNKHEGGVVVAGEVVLIIVLYVEQERNHKRIFSSRETIFGNSVLERQEHSAIHCTPIQDTLVLLITPTVDNNTVLLLVGKVEAKEHKDKGTDNNDGTDETNDDGQDTTLVNVD